MYLVTYKLIFLDENATDLSLKDCENLLTLIIMIYNKQTKNYFDLPPDVFSTVDIEPPTLSNTIKNLLYYIAASSPYCMNVSSVYLFQIISLFKFGSSLY